LLLVPRWSGDHRQRHLKVMLDPLGIISYGLGSSGAADGLFGDPAAMATIVLVDTWWQRLALSSAAGSGRSLGRGRPGR
jgi:hypothetical protein